MKAWKRCIAALLALIMMVTSTNFGFAAGTIDGETGVWSATAAEVVMEHYGRLSDKRIAAIFDNEAIDVGAEYTAKIPHANGTEGERDLLFVDYREKRFYVNSYEDNGLTWIPTEAVLLAEGEVKETFALTESVCYYNGVDEYYATDDFSYDGNNYTIEVTYELPLTIDLVEQQRILDIPFHLFSAVKNVGTTLSALRSDMQLFQREIPTLHKLLEMNFPADDGEEAVAFLNSEEHAVEINVIEELFAEYTQDAEELQLDLFRLSVESWSSELSTLPYAMAHGEEVREAAEKLHEKLTVLDESQRLRFLLSNLKTVDAGVHTSLKSLYKYMGRLMSPLEKLKDPNGWMIVDSAVQESVFKDEYEKEALDELGMLVSSIRSYISPTADDGVIVAAKETVSCEIVSHDVSVKVNAKVIEGGVENDQLKDLGEHTCVVRVLDGATQWEIDDAVAYTGIENEALSAWNAESAAYKIDTANYRRSSTVVDGALKEDLLYEISYEPNVYSVKTDYGVNMSVPFGYRLKLPVCTEDDGWYDYNVRLDLPGVEDKDKPVVSQNQGVVYTVECDITITRSIGSAKFEYRVLDFLAEDVRFGMKDAEKSILGSSALNSPTLKIRLPGASVGTIRSENGGFAVEVDDMAAGMGGMVWTVDSITLYNDDKSLGTLVAENGKAFWETPDFTHVIVDYSMQITKVRDEAGIKTLTGEKIEEYANLPYVLSVEVGEQARALSGDNGVTAKVMLEKMGSYESVMGMLKSGKDDFLDYLNTTAAKNALLRLVGSESEKGKGIDGKPFAYGGWSDYADKPAFFYYLEKCESAGWSVATYYQQKYYEDLSKHATLMADCLKAIVEDAGFVTAANYAGMSDKVAELKKVIPELYELAGKMNGPSEHLQVSHAMFADLIADILAAEGVAEKHEGISDLYAYKTVRRNDEEKFGSLQITIQKENLERTMTLDYKLEAFDGERYHVVTEDEAQAIAEFVASAETALDLDEEEKQFHDPVAVGKVPVKDDKLRKGVTSVLREYVPKYYTVIISGLEGYQIPPIRYNGSDCYVINLPARSDNHNDQWYYEYTFPDGKGGVLDVVSVENGIDNVGHFYFNKQQLLTLFSAGSYTIYCKEAVVQGVPTMVFTPKLSAEWIRGAVVDTVSNIMYLDAVPGGLTRERFVEQVTREVVNGKEADFDLYGLDGNILTDNQLVGTGTEIRYQLTDVFGKGLDSDPICYTIVMMGDVDGDGICNDVDVEMVAKAYFLEIGKDQTYRDVILEKFELGENAFRAANMNNSGKLDSNDAWLIRSKGLHWEGDWNKYQIVYRSVLR